MKTNKDIKELAELIGAVQDTIRVNANTIKAVSDLLYANIITLDLVYMDLVSELPEKTRRKILQNQFDESKSGAENDLVAMIRIRDYFDTRIEHCKEFIERDED